MKLSKQERIGLLIILSVVILALGAFLLVKPAFEEIGVTKDQLAAKEAELKELQDKAANKQSLRDQILSAYERGAHLADMFFPEMTTYDLDDTFREFIQQVKANVVVQEVSVSEPGTVTLNSTFFSKSTVNYPLKSYATQGVESTEEEVALAARMAAVQSALSNAQTVGASQVSVTVSALSTEDLIKFADEVNEYMKEENGVLTRKAISIPSLDLDYSVVSELYDSLMITSNNEAENIGIDGFNQLTGYDVSHNEASDGGLSLAELTGGEEGGEGRDGSAASAEELLGKEPESSSYVKELSTTITFYCIERMQDPTPQLNAQDGITE